jgi:predicted permease
VLQRARSLLSAWFGRRQLEDRMSDEMRFHIAEYTEDLIRSGLSREHAARQARMEFGSIDSAKDDCREARGLRLFDELQRHVRYAIRLLRKSPGFTFTALATLALCLGANLTIFAVVDSVLLRPLPFPASDRLVGIFNSYPIAGVPNDGISLTNYYERRGRIAALESISIYRGGTAIVGETGATAREYISLVSPEFFATLGLGPVMGRAFTEAETTYETSRVAILTDAFWRQSFNADPAAIGKTVRIDGNSHTIIGILPPSFSFLSSKARIYLPLPSSLEQRRPDRRHWGSAGQMIARLAPGATMAEAQAQIDASNTALEAATGGTEAKEMAEAGFRSIVVQLHADHVASIRPMVLLMQAGAAMLLLIGAVNLVNLLLIRASGRVKELAVRQALGANRRHVIGEVLVESTVLALIGGLFGLAVGFGGIRLLMLLGADQLPLGTHIAFDTRLALVALGGAIATGIAIGLPIVWYNLRGPAGQAARGSGAASTSTNPLQYESRGSTAGRAAQRMRHAFVIAQMALAFILLAGAGLLSLSLRQAMSVSPGFHPEHVLSGQVSLPGQSYPTPAGRLAFTGRLLDALGQQPGVTAVGLVDNVPLSGRSGKSAATIKGYARKPGEAPRGHYSYSVAGDYFTAMGFALREGRFLARADSDVQATRVCVVDEDFARYYWPHGGAIGQRLWQGGSAGPDIEAYTIVGIVGAVKQAGLTDEVAQGAIYYPYGARPEDGLFVVARGSQRPEALASILQRVVRQLDPDLPLYNVLSMDDRIADSLIARRSPALLAMMFSAIAILLTAIGTYGVLSYAVAQRRREIGLRMALGAQPAQMRRQFLSLALRLIAAGTILGVLGAWVTGRAMQTLLFHVPALHIGTLAITTAIVAIGCVLACLLPAERAARISPMEALTDQ